MPNPEPSENKSGGFFAWAASFVTTNNKQELPKETKESQDHNPKQELVAKQNIAEEATPQTEKSIKPQESQNPNPKQELVTKQNIAEESTPQIEKPIKIDSEDFSSSIDAQFQTGADDFYAQAKASCFQNAITEVKTYSSCLIQPKDTIGGTFGCLQYKFTSDDLLRFCEKTYPYSTNDKVEELISKELERAQNVEYTADGNVLTVHDDSSLFGNAK